MILKGSGKQRAEGEGGQLLRERAQTATEHYCVMPKGETEHTTFHSSGSIGQSACFVCHMLLCLMDFSLKLTEGGKPGKYF